MSLSEMAYNILSGCNENEVQVVPKSLKKKGFLKSFFNYLVKIVFSGNICCF